MATDILIIEDEPLIAMDLEALVEGLGHNVTGVARTRTEAVKLASAKRPGLILADIQLADGSSGLDAVNDLLKSFEVPVIFITAYPERFLTGERPEPAFLIAKPFQPANVSAVISQALFFQQSAHERARRPDRPDASKGPLRRGFRRTREKTGRRLPTRQGSGQCTRGMRGGPGGRVFGQRTVLAQIPRCGPAFCVRATAVTGGTEAHGSRPINGNGSIRDKHPTKA